jgi:hypothetical protein
MLRLREEQWQRIREHFPEMFRTVVPVRDRILVPPSRVGAAGGALAHPELPVFSSPPDTVSAQLHDVPRAFDELISQQLNG